jgi:hypothetical protein
MISGIRQKATGIRKAARIFALCTTLFALRSAAAAQQPTKMPRIGLLFGLNRVVNASASKRFA